MKVLFVHTILGAIGGAESTIRHLGAGLRDRGLDVGFLYGELTSRGLSEYSDLFPHRWCWNDGQLEGALAWKPDVVFVHKLEQLAILERLIETRRPLVRMVHDHDIYCQRRHRYLPWNRQICTRRAGWTCGALCGVLRGDRGFPLRIAWPGKKLQEIALCQRFDHHITVSDFLKSELLLHGFDASRITTLWPAISDPMPTARTTYAEPLVVFAGQVLRGKGVDVLLEALPLLKTPGWRCSIIGDGSHKKRCQELALELGLADRVRFWGWVPQQEFHRTLRNARVGVVPSVWPEPLGAVGIEMLRHGLPVVAHDVGGIGEWLQEGSSGYLVPPFDRATLAERIDRLLTNVDLARRLGEQGRTQAAEWCNVEQYFDDVIALLARVTAPGARPVTQDHLTPDLA